MSLIPVVFFYTLPPPTLKLPCILLPQLADLNRRLPAEAGLLPAKPGPLRTREAPPPPRPSPHTITLQTPAFRNLRLPKRLRVVYFLARTRLAQRIIMVRPTQATKRWAELAVSHTDPSPAPFSPPPGRHRHLDRYPSLHRPGGHPDLPGCPGVGAKPPWRPRGWGPAPPPGRGPGVPRR